MHACLHAAEVARRVVDMLLEFAGRPHPYRENLAQQERLPNRYFACDTEVRGRAGGRAGTQAGQSQLGVCLRLHLHPCCSPQWAYRHVCMCMG